MSVMEQVNVAVMLQRRGSQTFSGLGPYLPVLVDSRTENKKIKTIYFNAWQFNKNPT
jgi:hypothetical protein